MQLKKTHLLILFMVLFQAALMASNPYPVQPDVFERMRMAAYFQENLSFPDWDNAIAPDGAPFVYPPLADILLGIFSFMGMDLAWKLLALLFYLIFLAGIYKFSGLYLNEKQQTYLFIFLLLSPLVARKFIIYVAEIIALSLMPWLFYAIKKEKKAAVAAIILAISLTHLRSFATITAILLVYALALLYFNRSKLNAFITPMAAGLVLALPWYALNLEKLLLLKSYYSPYAGSSILGVLEFIGLPLLLFFLLFIPLRKKFKFDVLLPVIFLVPVVSLVLPTIFPLRQITFLLIPLGIFSAFAFSQLANRCSPRRQALVLLLVVVVSSLFFIYPKTIYTDDDAVIINALNETQEPGTVLFADPWLSYWAAEQGFSVVVGPFMERVPDATERMVAMEGFLFKPNPATLERYQVDCYVYRDNSGLLPGFREVIATPSKNLFCRT